jgi:hypothetical protein
MIIKLAIALALALQTLLAAGTADGAGKVAGSECRRGRLVI